MGLVAPSMGSQVFLFNNKGRHYVRLSKSGFTMTWKYRWPDGLPPLLLFDHLRYGLGEARSQDLSFSYIFYHIWFVTQTDSGALSLPIYVMSGS